MMLFFPDTKQPLINSIINNPYDLERDFFTQHIMQQIPYFNGLSRNFLRTIYYRSRIEFFDQDQIIFDVS